LGLDFVLALSETVLVLVIERDPASSESCF